jgi:hypothetical protein
MEENGETAYDRTDTFGHMWLDEEYGSAWHLRTVAGTWPLQQCPLLLGAARESSQERWIRRDACSRTLGGGRDGLGKRIAVLKTPLYFQAGAARESGKRGCR